MSKAVWSYKKLNELGFVGRGKSKHRPRNAAFLYGGPYPFIQTGDVKEADLYITDYIQTYSETGLAQSKLWEPDTLCITIAANIAETAILKIRACFPDSIVGFVADPAKADVRFVKYYIDTIKLKMQNVSKGTTQDNLSLEKLLSFDFFTPPVEAQRRIASILSAYDDLIENNTRRIKILEEMAQRLYREWFVHFRFPGHEKVKIKGGVPEGWEKKRLGEIATLSRGRSYRTPDLVDEGGLPFLNLKCVERGGGFRVDGLKRYQGIYKETQTAKAGDIVVAVTDMTQERRLVAHAARVPQMREDKFVLSMDLVKIEPAGDAPNEYLYAMFRFSGFSDEVKQHANGANVLHLNPERITAFELALPPKDLMEKYTELASDIFEQYDILQMKNANLRRTRDLLLPKLVSGEVEAG